MLLKEYVLIRKRTLCLTAAVAAGLVGMHYYKAHRPMLNQWKENVEQMAEKGKDKTSRAVEELKK